MNGTILSMVIGKIKGMTPAERQFELKSILEAMPDDWLAEAQQICSAVLSARQMKAPQVEYKAGLHV